jgi:predicted PurR-regulated permease PerM
MMDIRPLRRRGGGYSTLLWTQLGALIGFALLLFVTYQLYLTFQTFGAPVAWAIILRFAFQPIYAWLQRIVGHRPNLVALLGTAITTLAVAIPALAIFGILTHEAVAAFQDVRRFIQGGGLELWGEKIRTLAWIPFWEWLSPWVSTDDIQLSGIVLRAVNVVGDFTVEQMTLGAANLVLLSVKFLLMLLTLFFVFRDGEAFYQWVQTIIPLPAAQQARVSDRLSGTVTAVMYGIGVAAVVQGTLSGLAYWILGVPFPAFWGLLTAVVAPIPLGGTGLIWVPAGIYLIATESWVRGVILLCWGGLVVSTFDNVVKTLLISERTRLPALLLFFAILGGLRAYGVLGIFLGPLLLSLVITGISLYREMSSTHRQQGE